MCHKECQWISIQINPPEFHNINIDSVWQQNKNKISKIKPNHAFALPILKWILRKPKTTKWWIQSRFAHKKWIINRWNSTLNIWNRINRTNKVYFFKQNTVTILWKRHKLFKFDENATKRKLVSQALHVIFFIFANTSNIWKSINFSIWKLSIFPIVVLTGQWVSALWTRHRKYCKHIALKFRHKTK